MPTYNKNDISESISNINSIIFESTLNVYKSLSAEYDKALTILENYDGDDLSSFNIFQEESIIDKATGKNTVDSPIMKIIKFLPRLLIAIGESIYKFFTKDFKKDTTEGFKNVNYVMNNASQEELSNIESNIKNVTKSRVSFNSKSKKFTFIGFTKDMLNKAELLAGLAGVLQMIRQEIKLPNTPYKKLTEELKNVINKDKDVDETTLELSATALETLISDLQTTSMTVAAGAKELSGIIQSKMEKDFANGKNTQNEADAKALVDEISKISKHISRVTFFCSITKKAVDVFGYDLKTKQTGSQKLISKFSKKYMHTEENDEIRDLNDQNKNLESIIRGARDSMAVEEELHKEKQKERKKNEKLKKKAEKEQTKLKNARERRKVENEEYEDED